MSAKLLDGARIMSAAEFAVDVLPERPKVASRKTGMTDWAALSPTKQAHDLAAFYAAKARKEAA